MADSKTSDSSSANDDLIAGLTRIDIEAMPGFEELFLVQLVQLAPDEPKEGPASVADAAQVLGLWQTALSASNGRRRPSPVPEIDDDIAKYRKAFVDGAHGFVAQDHGLERLIARLIPTAQGQLDENRGDLDGLVQGLYSWVLLAIASGPDSQDPAMWAWTGIRSSLAKWSEILTSKP
jgi:hypothetical protein